MTLARQFLGIRTVTTTSSLARVRIGTPLYFGPPHRSVCIVLQNFSILPLADGLHIDNAVPWLVFCGLRQPLCSRQGRMDDLPRLFWKRVRTIRKAANITQEDAAERAKIHAKYLGEIERGEKRPSFEAILALADALGTSPAAFFQFDKEESSERVLRKKIDALIGAVSADDLQRVYRVLRAMLEP